MSRQRFLQLLGAAILCIAAGWYLAAQRNGSQDAPGVALLPKLTGEANAITAVTIRKGAATPAVTVHKSGDRWTVAERADYPADVTKLRKLLQSLRDAKIVEEKTSDPSRFQSIGVEDPAAPGTLGVEITLLAPAGNIGVIVGKPLGSGNFVRRSGEKVAYSVEPGISVESEPRYWIDAKLLDLQSANIQRIDVTLQGSAGYSLRRANPSDNTYSLDAVPAGRKALDGHALAPSPSTFGGLTAEDVAAASDIDFGKSSQANLTLADGNVIGITGAIAGEKRWILVKAGKDAELAAKVQGRAFEIAPYRYDAIFKPLEQLLEPKPAPNPGKSASKSAPAPAPEP
jgi:hypothetical protein